MRRIDIFIRLCVVKHDNFERESSFRMEAISGKVIGDIGRAETVTDRT